MNNKVVLAFSGGLDTSFCVPYLKNEKGLEVHTIMVNTGGFSEAEAKAIGERALTLGAASHVTVDASHTYYKKGLKYLIFGNVLKNATYPLSVSSERVFQALEVYKHVKKLGASYVAHGSTGAGNDQVRFDIVFEILAPEVQIIAPIRELSIARQDEIKYLNDHGFNFSWEKAKYSINQGLWGTSVGGVETLSSEGYLPEEAYPIQVTKHGHEHVRIGFKAGEPVSLNGTGMDPVDLIRTLHDIPFCSDRLFLRLRDVRRGSLPTARAERPDRASPGALAEPADLGQCGHPDHWVCVPEPADVGEL